MGLSVVDQAILSGANFVLSVLLARWLAPAAYGAFAVAFSVFLLLAGIHNALIIDPMSVLGPQRFSNRLAAYLKSLLWAHGGLTLGLSFLTALGASVAIFLGSLLGTSLLGLAVMLPCTLLFWMLRRACYLETRVKSAFLGTVSYALLLLTGLYALRRMDAVTTFNAFGINALASLGASVPLCLLLLRRSPPGETASVSLAAVREAHWHYGRWLIGATLAHSLTSAIFAPLVAGVVGLAQAGTFRAMQNLVSPIVQATTAFGTLLLPWMSKRRSVDGARKLERTARRLSWLYALAALCYAALVLPTSGWLIQALYASTDYAKAKWLLMYMMAAVVFLSATQPLGLALRALEKPWAVFRTKLAAAACLLCLGVPLVLGFGLLGAGFGLLLVALVESAGLLYYSRRVDSAAAQAPTETRTTRDS